MGEIQIKIAAVQYFPEFKQPLLTLQKVQSMVSSISQCDILILPQMALAGYTFESQQEILPFLQKPQPGFPTFDFCVRQARRLNCYVFCGYPQTTQIHFYNSMLGLDQQGNLIVNHRKKLLIYIDKSWAKAGQNFHSVNLSIKGIEIVAGLGICADILADQNKSTGIEQIDLHPLAQFWKNADLCLFSTNWVCLNRNYNVDKCLEHWYERLAPLLVNDKPRYFIAADRVGKEKEIIFQGNSAIIKLGDPSEVLGILDQVEETVLETTIRFS